MAFNVHWAIGCCWIALGLLWLVGAFFSKPTQRSQSMAERSTYIALAAIGILLISRLSFHGPWISARFLPDTYPIQLTGFAITVCGTLFAAWARLTLGSNWSGRATVKAGHELIVRGPYAIARHPIYTGILLALAGTIVANAQWRYLEGFAIIVLALLVKMRQEERLMIETFPQQYPDYRRRVKALVPFLY